MELILSAAVKTLLMAARTLPVVFISLIVIEILIRNGRLNSIYFFFMPLLKRTGLPAETSASFITAIGSPLAAGAMLKKFHNEGKITSPELLLAAQTNSLPGYFKGIFTRFIPVMIPILGMKPGIIYTLSFFFVGILKFFLILAAGSVRCRIGYQGTCNAEIKNELPSGQHIDLSMLTNVIRESMSQFTRIAKMMFIAVFAVNMAEGAGILLNLQELLRPALNFAGIREDMILPVLAYVGNATAGGLVIGTLYRGGTIGFYTAAISALAGNLISFPLYLFKFSFARNMAVYGPKLGSIHVVITLIIGIAARLIFIMLFIIFFKFYMA